MDADLVTRNAAQNSFQEVLRKCPLKFTEHISNSKSTSPLTGSIQGKTLG